MFKSIIPFIYFCLFSSIVFGQHGTVDMSFNNYDTTLLGMFNGPDETIYDVAVQADGKFLMGGDFFYYDGQQPGKFTRILSNGQRDPDFNQSAILPSNSVQTIAIQADGKILVAGVFTYWNTENVRLVRLNVDGTRDMSLNAGIVANSIIRKIIVQVDQKIIVIGNFTLWNGQATNHIVRLNPDGSMDPTFSVGTGDNNWISSISQTNDNGLILVGDFTSFNGTACNGYIKLLPDGSVDPAFIVNSIPINSNLRKIVEQTDGKIIIGAAATVFRLNSDGSLDTTFSAPIGGIKNIRLLSNGKIAVCGIFSTFGGIPTNKIALLNSDGSIDPSFITNVTGSSTIEVNSIAETADGNLIFGGTFTYVNGITTPNFGIVNQNGQLPGPAIGFETPVKAISVQVDNKIIAGGTFTSYNGTPCTGLVRIQTDGSIDPTFTASVTNVNETFVQPDGKILVANNYQLIRLNSDGSNDTGFTPATFTDGEVFSIAMQSDGKILVAGSFWTVNGLSRKYIARLNSNGTADAAFSSPLSNNVTFGMQAQKVRILSSGKIMVSGKFGCCPPIVRLNTNGTMDNSFYFNSTAYRIYDFVELQNGDIVVGGVWSSSGGHSTYFIHRRNANGSADGGFTEINGGSSGYTPFQITTLTKLSDEKILATGSLPEINNLSRACFIFDANGGRDTGFDVNENFNNTNIAYDAGVQSDGRIIVAGNFQSIGNKRRFNIARLDQTFFINDAICVGGTYTLGSQLLTQAGTYTETFTSSIGTDSVVVLNLSVYVLNSTLSATTCDSFILNAETYYTSGTYTQNLTNFLGCDSIVTLNLTVNVLASSLAVTACDSFTLNAETYYASGTYTQLLTNSLGCDSTVTLDLTIANNSGSISLSACDSVVLNSETFTSSGIYYQTLLNQFGCDSVLTINLNIISSLPTTNEVFVLPSDTSICTGFAAINVNGMAPFTIAIDNYTVAQNVFNYSGIEQLCPGIHTLQTINSCTDTLAETIVIPIDSNFVFNNAYIDSMAIDSLGAIVTNCEIYYNEIDTAFINSIISNGNQINVVWNIIDSNGSNYDTVTYNLNNGNGVYWVQLSVYCPTKAVQDYFTVTEAIYFLNGEIITASIDEMKNNTDVSIFPNPTFDFVTVQLGSKTVHTIEILDTWGRTVKTINVNTEKVIIDLHNLERGVYNLKLITNNSTRIDRVVKQ